MKLAVLIVVFLFAYFVFVVSAAALPEGLPAAAIERGFAVGQQYWGAACQGEPIPVEWEDPDFPGDVSWAAYSHWHFVNWTQDSPYTDCRITFNTYYRNYPFMHDPEWVCTAMVHELGHLTRHSHSDDPSNVMHAPFPIIAECRVTDVASRPKSGPKRPRPRSRGRTWLRGWRW